MSNIMKTFVTIVLMVSFIAVMIEAAGWGSVAFAVYLFASAVVLCFWPNKKIEAEHEETRAVAQKE